MRVFFVVHFLPVRLSTHLRIQSLLGQRGNDDVGTTSKPHR